MIANNNIFSILAVSCIITSGCMREFNEHYGDSNAVAHQGTVYDCLQEDGRFTRFLSLVDEAGLKGYLTGNDLVTIWAPTDETAPETLEEMSTEDRKFLVQNHISISTIYSRNVASSAVIATVAGKNFNASNTAAEGFVVGGRRIVSPDRLYQNGLVQELDGWLEPRKNISQWLDALSDDYSIFRDSLRARNVRVFDKENSPILGVDEEGTVVYDSVWVVTNDYLNNIDLGNEAGRYTLFVPDNDAVNGAIERRREYFSSVGRDFTGQDSLDFLNWVMRASIFRGDLEVTDKDILKSVSGKELRMSYQRLKDTVLMSNGRVYTYDTLYVPRDVHYKKLEFNPYYIRREILATGGVITTNNRSYDKYYAGVNNTASKIIDDAALIYWQFNSTATDNYYQFEARGWDEVEECTVDMPVMPGHYTLRMQFVNQGDNFNTDVLDIYEVVTTEEGATDLLLINSIRGITKKYYYTEASNGINGVVSEDWEFTGNYGKRVFRAVIPGSYTTGEKRRICAGVCTLIPNDNY
ncbi:MAG: fasciclin domain-containing protein [Candidatus Cryptobacteroides sp.]